MRTLRLVPILAIAASAALVAAPGSADAAQDGGDSIFVVEVDGLLDPVTAELIERSLAEAEREGAALFVLSVDSPASLDVSIVRLSERFSEARVPVVAWVPAGGAARGGSGLLVFNAPLAAMARDAELQPDSTEIRVDLEAPTLRDLIAVLDGREVNVKGEVRTLDLGDVVGEGDDAEKRVLPIRFRQLDLVDQTQHALTSPFVAYLLLVLGLCLIVFEFFAVGIGLAAAAGTVLVLAAFVGFVHLPVDAWALARLVAGVAAVSVDVQAGRPRFWALVGSGLLVESSISLYDGPGALDPPLWQVLSVVAGALVFLLPGLAAVIRARFSTPTIGREWIVGEQGVAQVEFDQDGVVKVRDALWRANSSRAARIAPGDPVRVTAVRGLVLEVEPVEDGDA